MPAKHVAAPDLKVRDASSNLAASTILKKTASEEAVFFNIWRKRRDLK